jgi:sugar phosphate isomerase/epimerase
VTQPGIPNDYSLSTSCYGTRLATIEDQAFAAVAMGFRKLELGLTETPVSLNGFEDIRRETGVEVASLVTGCLNPRSEHMSGTKLGSLDAELRNRALLSSRRHIQVAKQYGCPTVILRGCEVEDQVMVAEAKQLEVRHSERNEDTAEGIAEEIADFVHRVQKKGQSQVEHLCRSIHTLRSEFPDIRLAVEPGATFIDILNFEAMGWVLDDLAKQDLSYWHDTGTVHLREVTGLPGQGAWLDQYGSRLIGIHLQDAVGEESEMPPGLGEVDFRQVSDYIPESAEKVVEIHSRHGRSEILAAVQFLIDRGF